MRLRRTSPNDPGWTRRRAGRGFVYLDERGARLDAESVERIKALVIPPAWTDVWICTVANGHLQVVGVDVAGRRQYLYHPMWRHQRDVAKFDRALLLAKALPKARQTIQETLAQPELSREQVLAVAVRLLDLGYFRIGNDVYADEHGSYGLTTLERRHVRRHHELLRFRFVGKSGVEHQIEVDDLVICQAVDRLRRRRGGGDRLLAWKESRRWRAVEAADVNEFLDDVFAVEVTAKDFRTWHATVIAATMLGEHASTTSTASARKRLIRQCFVEVAGYLGNTPTIAKTSYVDPRVIDLYESGTTIAAALRRLPTRPDERRNHVERAVLRLLS